MKAKPDASPSLTDVRQEGELGIGPIPTGPWFGYFPPEWVPNPQ
jgi:hypothetical protein